MKGEEVYAELTAKLSPWFVANGFAKRSAGRWRTRRDDRVILASFQITGELWDDWAGKKFTFQFRDERIAWGHRLGRLVGEQHLRDAQALNNRIVASLARPPATHFDGMDANVRTWYLRKFEPDDVPWTSKHDLWFRYRDASHVRQWAAWLETALGEAFERFLSLPLGGGKVEPPA